MAFPYAGELRRIDPSIPAVRSLQTTVELMVAIAAIGKCDLCCRATARTLVGMGQDTENAGSIDRLSASAHAASRYSRTAIMLHWIIAVLVLSTIPLGLYGTNFDGDLARTAKDIHKPIGILILALTLVRIGWRLSHVPPALPDTMTLRRRRIARGTHVAFYVLLLLLPLSGWWMSSAVPERHPISFGLFDVPFLPVPRGFGSAGPAHLVHTVLGFSMIGLAALHIAAALRHHFVQRDDVLARMLPRRA